MGKAYDNWTAVVIKENLEEKKKLCPLKFKSRGKRAS